MSKYLFIFFALLILGCQTKTERKEVQPKTKYFSKLTGIISPYMEYNPRGELNLKKLDNRPYYMVSYGQDGQLSEIRYYKYGSKSNDSYFGSHRVSYNYLNNSLVREYFDLNEKRSHMDRHYYGGGNIHKEVFQLSNSGNKQSLILKDTLDNQIASGFGTYLFKWKTNSPHEFVQEQFKEDGSRNYLTNYFPFYRSSITIDQKGHLFSIINLDTLNGNPKNQEEAGYSKVIFDFDQYGNEKGWSFLDLENNLATRNSVVGMEYGYAKVAYDFEWTDQKLGHYSTFAMKFLDTSEKPIASNDGIHSTLFEFDDFNNLVSMSYFNENNDPIIHQGMGFHKMELSYDNQGNQSSIARFDEKNVPIKE